MSIQDMIISVDIGGSFTDCVIQKPGEALAVGKALSSPGDDFETGFFTSLAAAGSELGYQRVSDILEETATLIAHASTVGTNILVEGQGRAVGLLTTTGHEDTLTMMRGEGRIMGEPPEAAFDFIAVPKPAPLVPRERTRGVIERVDARGNVLVALDERQVEREVRGLAELGCDAFAVCLLWSIQEPAHERRIRDLILGVYPEAFVSLSHELSKAEGEYERMVASVINAYVGPRTRAYLTRLQEAIAAQGCRRPFMVMQCHGGMVPLAHAMDAPILTIGSGPVGGLIGTQRLAEEYGVRDVIATDMGGTSFDVGIVKDGEPLLARDTVLRKLKFHVPSVEVVSIGAGGGTVARFDRASGSIRLGPDSAGSDPGPACYGLGGTEATVTDANLVLGYLNPDGRLGTGTEGTVSPRRDLADAAIRPLADAAGMSVIDAALGIVEIANNKMANLIDNLVVGRGFDPREFLLLAYGGSGPLHAAGYAHAMGVSPVVVPGKMSALWSAFGVGLADVRHQVERDLTMLAPFDDEALAATFAELESELADHQGQPPAGAQTRRHIKLRYQWQQHWLEVGLPSTAVAQDTVQQAVAEFERRYAERYSEAALLPGARLEIVGLRLEAVASRDTSMSARAGALGRDGGNPAPAQRPVAFRRGEPSALTEVYDGERLAVGTTIVGPAIIDLPTTSVVVPPDWSVRQTETGDYLLNVTETEAR